MAGHFIVRKLFVSLLSNKSFTGKVFASRNVIKANFSTNTLKSKQPSLLLLTFVGAGAGAVLGGGYSFYATQQALVPIFNEGVSTGRVLERFPDVSVSRRIFNAADTSGLDITLFQYPTCPFCCKVRAFLNFHGISYNVVEVNPVLRQQIKWSDYKKVPTVLIKVGNGYQQLNDSSMIISALSSYLQDSHPPDLSEMVRYYPSVSFQDDEGALKSEVINRYFLMFNGEIPKNRNKEELEEERKWRKWADNVLVHMLSPNVYRTREEAMQAFTWFSEVGEWDRLFSSWERNLIVYAGAYAMLMIGKRLKKRHNLKNDVRQSLYDECNNWMRALKKKKSEFMGGNQPNLADLAVYGVLSSIEGCNAFEDVLHNTKIGSWYWPMKKLVQSHSGVVIS